MKPKGAAEEASEAQADAEEAEDLAQQSLDMSADAEVKAEEVLDPVEEEVPEPVDDEAEAVGDPHMTLATGEKEDLCCEGSVCKVCPDSTLLQHDEDVEAGGMGMGMGKMGRMGMGKMGRMGMGMGMGEPFEEAFDAQEE